MKGCDYMLMISNTASIPSFDAPKDQQLKSCSKSRYRRERRYKLQETLEVHRETFRMSHSVTLDQGNDKIKKVAVSPISNRYSISGKMDTDGYDQVKM